jgi:hypothetical protein
MTLYVQGWPHTTCGQSDTMLEIRRVPLPGFVEYALDSAAEASEIDACTNNVLRLYGEPAPLEEIVGPPLARAEIQEWVDAIVRGEKPENRREANAIAMTAYASSLLAQLDEQWRGALIYDGLRGLSYQISSVSEIISSWAITDAVQGGSSERFKHGREVQLDRHRNPYRRVYRRLCAPSFIRHYAKRLGQGEIGSLLRSTEHMLALLQTVPHSCIRKDPQIWSAFDEQLEFFRQNRTQRIAEEETRLWQGAFTEERAQAQIDPKRKKLLKRASKMASGVLGQAATGALARGEKIKVEGPSLVLQLQKRGMLSDFGHSTLDVQLLDHAGVPLADLCIYQDNVPAIDQAVGLSLMVQSGLEEQLLDEANLIRVTEAGAENALVAAKQRSCTAAAIDWAAQNFAGARSSHFRGHWTWEEERAWQKKYWEATKQVWIDAIVVRVLGRNRKLVQSLLGQERLNEVPDL